MKKVGESKIDADLTEVGQIPFDDTSVSTTPDSERSDITEAIIEDDTMMRSGDEVADLEAEPIEPSPQSPITGGDGAEEIPVCNLFSSLMIRNGLTFKALDEACSDSKKVSDKMADLEHAKDILDTMVTMDITSVAKVEQNDASCCGVPMVVA